jgi:heme/copper-type cytochrome/quinol oxidase subunit 4
MALSKKDEEIASIFAMVIVVIIIVVVVVVAILSPGTSRYDFL